MQELDTYHCMERFARCPDDPDALLAYLLLKRRTGLHIQAEAIKLGGLERMDIFRNILLGCHKKQPAAKRQKKPSISPESLYTMDAASRDKLYCSLCNSVGIHIDPETLVKERNKEAK